MPDFRIYKPIDREAQWTVQEASAVHLHRRRIDESEVLEVLMELIFSGEAARRAGISREVLLKWEQRGIIPPAARVRIGPQRTDRVYTAAEVDRITQLAEERGLSKERIAA